MEYQHLIEKMQKLEAIVPKVHDLFELEIQQLKNQYFLDSAVSLSAAFEKINKEGRLLNIGIVGRVKAGKSSLLNALFFEGENILPKAATPMTAALTTLTYGERFRATVDFFTADDVKHLEHNAKQYLYTLNKIKDKKYELFSSRPRTSTEMDEERASSLISKQALQEMQNLHPELCASHDQFERMRLSGLALEDLESVNVVEPESRAALSQKLLEYVGADGKYMPFTKAVNISMPQESLKDICVIDTPGMNDPVQSREARTVELLKTCDVIFIVSPAGQFLNENDLELMGRITQKEGVQELVLIASQVDTQLYGSERRPSLDQTLNNIKTSLAQRATSTLHDLRRSNPEIGTVFNNIIRAPGDYLMYSSGVAHGISQRLENPDNWDSNEKKTWENLTTNYCDYFSSSNHDLTKNSLAKLGNISVIHHKINAVRSMKDDILSKKMQQLVERKKEVFERFNEALLSLVEQRIALVSRTDLDTLAKQSKTLSEQRSVLDKKLNQAYSKCVKTHFLNVKESLNSVANKLFQQTNQSIEEKISSETTVQTRDKSGVFNWIARKLWEGGQETITKTEKTIYSPQAYTAMKNFIETIEAQLKKAGIDQQSAIDLALSRLITPLIDDILKGEVEVMMISDVVLAICQQIRSDEFSLDIPMPDELLPDGILKGDAAEIYIDNATNYIAFCRSSIYTEIDRYFNRIQSEMPSTISDEFVNLLDSQINQIKNQVENCTQTIERLQRFSLQVQGIR